MLDKILTQYDRRDGIKADLGEKFGNFNLYFLRTAFGKTYIVTDKFIQKDKKSLAIRVLNLALAILTCPLILIGAAGTLLSRTHGLKALNHDENSLSPKINSPFDSPTTSPEKQFEAKNLSEYVLNKIASGQNPRAFGVDTIEKLKDLVKTHGPTLKSIELTDFDLSEDFNEIISSIGECTILGLHNCKLADDISKLNDLNLTRLVLRNCGINDEMVKQIVPTIEDRDFVFIVLSKNEITDIGAETLANLDVNLHSLSLDSNKISDKGFSALINSKSNFDSLYIENNLLTANHIKSLSKTPNLIKFRDITFQNSEIDSDLRASVLLTREEIVQKLNENERQESLGIFNYIDLYNKINLNDLTHLNFYNCQLKKGFLEIIDKAPNLTSLDLSHCYFEAGVMQAMINKKRIKALDISHCDSQIDFAAIMNSEGSQTLTRLIANHTEISDLIFTGLVYSSNLENLEHLSVVGNNITDIGVESLVKWERPKFIRVLLNENKIRHQGVATILNNLDKFPSLQGIHFSQNIVSPLCFKDVKTIDSSGTVFITTSIKPEFPIPDNCRILLSSHGQVTNEDIIEEADHSKLKKLTLTKNLSHEDCVKICQLRDLKHLVLDRSALQYEDLKMLLDKGHFTKLSIYSLEFNDFGIDIIALNPGSSRLTHLVLQCMNMTDAQFQRLMASPHLSKLRILSVPLNKLTEVSIDALLNSDKKELVRINLFKNNISDSGVVKMVNKIDQFPKLINLDLGENFVSKEKLDEIKEVPHRNIRTVHIETDHNVDRLPSYMYVNQG